MGKIYKIDYDTRYANAVTEKDEYVRWCDFDGTPQKDVWRPVPIRSPFKSKKIVDFMYWDPTAIVASQKAVDILTPLFLPYAEILPLQCSWGNYYITNVTYLIDCINYTESEYIPFGDGKTEFGAPRVLWISKHVFYPERIKGIPIFKELNDPKGTIYVNEIFVDCVEKFKLKGLKFKLIWEG